MCTLHIMENGATVGLSEGKIYVESKEKKSLFPIETLDSISVYGKPIINTRCAEECMKLGIPILFFSQSGSYIGGYIGVKGSIHIWVLFTVTWMDIRRS